MSFETWGPPVVVMATGMVVGLYLSFRSGADQFDVEELRTRRGDLLARKEALLERIRALDADRGQRTEAELAAERERLIAEAAEVARALDELDPAGDAGVAEADRAAGGGRSPWQAAAAVVFFVLLGVALVKFTAPKGGGGMGGGGMGGGGMGGGGMAASAEVPMPPEVQQAMAALESNPRDLAALNRLTYHFMLNRDMQSAMSYLEQARKVSPDDPDVMVHLAVLQAAVGMFDRALPTLEAVLRSSPDHAKAWLWKGYVIARLGNGPRAVEAVKKALELGLDPQEQAIAASVLEEAATLPDVPVEAAPSVVTGDLPPGHATPTGGDAATPAAEASPDAAAPLGEVRGTVALAEGSGPVPEGAVLFVMARSTASAGGPPLAATRLAATGFPVSFSIGPDDVMMGGPWPDRVWLVARLDADGSLGTRGEGDLQSEVVGPVTAGSEPVTLTLR